jgi:predicted dehydrogenase
MSFTWAGHGEPTGLPDGMVVYGSKGNLKGNTLNRDGKPPIATIDLFRAEAPPDEQEKWIPLGLTDSFAAGFHDFLTAIERGRQPEASGEEGLRDVATAFAVLESSYARKAVAVEDVLTGRVRDAQRTIDANYGLA